MNGLIWWGSLCLIVCQSMSTRFLVLRFFAATSGKEVVFHETETGKRFAVASHADPVTLATFFVRSGVSLLL